MEEFFLSRDNSGHWYVVPVSKQAEWDAWLEIDEDDERAWTAPDGVVPVCGSPCLVRFTSWRIE